MDDINTVIHTLLFHSTGQTSDLIFHIETLQSPVFLLNSRFPHFRATAQKYIENIQIFLAGPPSP
jgi:hypothetical protein